MTDLFWLALPGLVAAVVALLLTPPVGQLAVRLGAVDEPGERKVHHVAVPRMGGLAVVASIAITFACAPWLSAGRWHLPSHLVSGVGFGVLPILAVSMIDDIRSLRPLTKSVAHLIGAIIAVSLGVSLGPVVHLFGESIEIGWMAIPLSVLWIVSITNAFNLIDGLDGLSTGLALIAAASMAIVFAIVGQAEMTGTSLVLAGALLGFLPYNLHPARLFLGDTGSTAIGFCLACFALRGGSTLSSGFAALLPVFILGLPIADMLIAVVRRTLHRMEHHAGGLFEPDRNHIHHRLLALGIGHGKAVLALYGAGLVLAGAALLSVFATAREAALMVFALLCAAFIGVQRLGYDEFAFIRRGTVLKVYELRAVKRGFFIVFVDLALTFVTAYIAMGLKTDAWKLQTTGPSVVEIATTLAPVTVAIFLWRGMYRGSWRVAGLQDLTRVLVSVTIATAVGALVLTLPPASTYPLSLFGIYGVVSLLLTASVRASYVILEYTKLRSTHQGSPVLIYGAGRRGAAAVRELFQNQALGLRPVGFIDDDPRKQGKYVTGLTVLGAGREIDKALESSGARGILISTEKIAAHRLERATDACRKLGGRVFHLDIGVHRVDRDEPPPVQTPAPAPIPVGTQLAWGALSTSLNVPEHLDSQPCPSCRVAQARRSRARNAIERVRKLRTDKRLYRCDSCQWRGWLTPMEFASPAAVAAAVPFNHATLDIPLQTAAPFARSLGSRQQ